MSLNAYNFSRDILEKKPEGSYYTILSKNLGYYFFSHLHNIELAHLEYPILVDHLQQFVNYYVFEYDGTDIGMAHSDYYKKLSQNDHNIQRFIWNVFYSLSLYAPQSKELNCFAKVLEWQTKDICLFFIECKKVIADMNSISLDDTYLDILKIEPNTLHLYFQAIYQEKAIRKMHLLKKVSDQNEIYASDLMKLWIEDYISLQKSNAFHHNKAQELSLNNLPFAKMQKAKESRANERDIETLEEGSIPLRKTLAFKANEKPSKQFLTQASILITHKDLASQCNYIRTETAKTEQKLVNGTTCLKEAVKNYNSLADYYNENHDKVFKLLK